MNGQISSDLNILEQFEDNSKPKKKKKTFTIRKRYNKTKLFIKFKNQKTL